MYGVPGSRHLRRTIGPSGPSLCGRPLIGRSGNRQRLQFDDFVSGFEKFSTFLGTMTPTRADASERPWTIAALLPTGPNVSERI